MGFSPVNCHVAITQWRAKRDRNLINFSLRIGSECAYWEISGFPDNCVNPLDGRHQELNLESSVLQPEVKSIRHLTEASQVTVVTILLHH